MKKIISILVLCMTFSTAVFAEDAAGDVKVFVNGIELKSDAKIVNGRTVLPMRDVFEKLGAEVTWIEADKLIFAVKDDLFITMQIGTPKMSVQSIESDDNRVIALDAAPFIDGGYTMIPVRAVAEALNADVDWSDETRTVNITK